MTGSAIKKQVRYPKVYRASISNPNAYTEKQLTIGVGSTLASSVSFWPENYCLQIDVITLPGLTPRNKKYDSNKSVQIFFSLKHKNVNNKAVEPFANWADDLFDILGSYMDFEPCTAKFYNEVLESVKPYETFEIVPYYEASHFTPDDFTEILEQKQDQNKRANVKIFDMLQDSIEDGFNSFEYFIQKSGSADATLPLPVVGNSRELFKKMLYNPGSHFRTIIGRANEQVVNEIREEASRFYNDVLGANFPVVNIRTTFSHTEKVPFDIKRVLSSLAKDSELTKLLHSEEVSLSSSPATAIKLSPRVALTATAFIRLPQFDSDSPYFACFNSSISGEADFYQGVVPDEMKLLQSMIRSEVKEMLPFLHDIIAKDVVETVKKSITKHDEAVVFISDNSEDSKQPSSQMQIKQDIKEPSELNPEGNVS